jgi:predicted ATPase
MELTAFTTLLEAAPAIKLMVTSRERLNLRGETIYALGGMTLPTEETRDEILKCSAVQLFIQRVQMIQTMNTVLDDELPFVVKICRQVWGMPLGIELAASLAAMLSFEEIATEIEQSYDILATEMRDMPPRLRSIRAVFDYSWSRLTETEQDVYMRLAVFRGGFTRQASQVVVGAALSDLTTLANKSLLQHEPDSGRYVIHELLRQYAEDQLIASGQADLSYQAHMIYYTDLLSQIDTRIKGADQLEALNQVEVDFENFRAAWQWAVEHEVFEAVNKSLEAIYWFCQIRARVPDGEMLFEQAREQFSISFDVDAHPVQRHLLLHFDASGDSYREQIEQMLAVVQEHGTQREIAFFLWMLGVNNYVSGNFDQAISIMEAAFSLFQTLCDDFYMIETLHSIGICKRFGGHINEAKLIEQQLRNLSRKTGNKYALGRALGSQGLLAIFENNDVKAIRDLEEAIAIRSTLGDTAGVAMSMVSLSLVAFFQGNLSDAKSLAKHSLSLATDSNSLFPKTMARIVLSWLASIEEDYARAWDLCYESLLLAPDPNVLFAAHVGLGMAACGLEDYSAAAKHMQSLFQANSPWHTTRGLTTCLPTLAVVHTSQGNFEQAIEVLALISTHPMKPTLWINQWALVGRLQTRLKTELTAEAFETVWQRGTTLELDAVISDWLTLIDNR